MIHTRLTAALTVAIGLCGAAGAQDLSPSAVRDLHDRTLTLDTHVDIGGGYATPKLDPGGFTNAQVDLPKMRAGGLDAGFFIVYTAQGRRDEAGYAAARQTAEDKYQAILRMVRAYPERIALATTADQVEEIAASGRLVALIGMENAFPLGLTLDDLPMWAERGVTYVSLTHFGHNQFGGSSNARLDFGDTPEEPGLTDLGRALVAALNDAGIMVDISHVGKRTGLEAMALSRAPVIASHSGARGVYDNPRNLDDEQLIAIRDNGGVAQMVAYRSYVAAVDPALEEASKALRERLGLTSGSAFGAASAETLAEYIAEIQVLRQTYEDVSLAQLIDHLDHAVAVAGIDHVGLSGDFDGGGGVQGWDNAAESPTVTAELVARGYSEEDIAKIWGGNVLRVMRDVESQAAP
jgi:membrane dipeptidase